MIDAAEAAAALRQVDRAHERATVLSGYAGSGDVLIAWGLVWMVGYAAMQAEAGLAPWTWAIGIAAAVLFTLVRSRRTQRNWRFGAIFLIAFGFVAALEAIMGGVDGRQHVAIVSLVVAAGYAALGLVAGLRYLLVGIMLAAMTVIGWFGFATWLYLWLGIGGGGALIVSGLWLRRA